MRPDAPALLWDARNDGRSVQAFLAGVHLDDYLANDLIRSAIERQLTIIGEALNRLSRLDPQTASSITDLERIVAFRNLLVHGYSTIDDALVWQLATSRLPALIAELDALLATVEG